MRKTRIMTRRRSPASGSGLRWRILTVAMLPALLAPAAQADETFAPGSFTLGTITVVGEAVQAGEVGSGLGGTRTGSVIEREEIRRFNRDTLGDALELLRVVQHAVEHHQRSGGLVIVDGRVARRQRRAQTARQRIGDFELEVGERELDRVEPGARRIAAVRVDHAHDPLREVVGDLAARHFGAAGHCGLPPCLRSRLFCRRGARRRRLSGGGCRAGLQRGRGARHLGSEVLGKRTRRRGSRRLRRRRCRCRATREILRKVAAHAPDPRLPRESGPS